MLIPIFGELSDQDQDHCQVFAWGCGGVGNPNRIGSMKKIIADSYLGRRAGAASWCDQSLCMTRSIRL